MQTYTNTTTIILSTNETNNYFKYKNNLNFITVRINETNCQIHATKLDMFMIKAADAFPLQRSVFIFIDRGEITYENMEHSSRGFTRICAPIFRKRNFDPRLLL